MLPGRCQRPVSGVRALGALDSKDIQGQSNSEWGFGLLSDHV